MADAFKAFKNFRQEKVIFDDDYWLDVMYKVAMGMSPHQAVMSKGS